MKLLTAAVWDGWTMMEASSKPADPAAALAEQQKIWVRLTAAAVS